MQPGVRSVGEAALPLSRQLLHPTSSPAPRASSTRSSGAGCWGLISGHTLFAVTTILTAFIAGFTLGNSLFGQSLIAPVISYSSTVLSREASASTVPRGHLPVRGYLPGLADVRPVTTHCCSRWAWLAITLSSAYCRFAAHPTADGAHPARELRVDTEANML